MDHQALYKKIEHHVTGLFEQVPHAALIFHNLEHTQKVVLHTEEIASHSSISDADMFILFAAAWFHDCGHLYTTPDKHEYKSCEIMKEYMSHLINDELAINKMGDCIMATKFPTNPCNLLEKIICDADTYHFGTPAFRMTNKRVFQEVQLTYHPIDSVTFKEGTLKMLFTHHFYTDYCRDLLNEGKAKNIALLQASSDNL